MKLILLIQVYLLTVLDQNLTTLFNKSNYKTKMGILPTYINTVIKFID